MTYSLSSKKIGTNFIIRNFSKKDSQGFTTLLSSVLKEFNMYLDPVYDNDLNDLPTFYGGKRDCFLIAEIDGRIVGSCAIKEQKPKVGEIRKLYVQKDFRNLGIGGSLLDKVLEHAHRQQYQKLFLTTDKQFIVASNLYQSRGFEIIKEINSDIFMEKII